MNFHQWTQSWYFKAVVAAIVLTAAIVLYWQFGSYLNLENLANQEAQLRQFQTENPILVYGIAFLIYVAVTGFSLPGALVLTVVFAWYFGFWRGAVLISFASTTGATLAFLLSRYLLRDWIQNRFGKRLSAFNENLEREGPFYLFSLRLIPVVPFFVINLVMGLTPMKTRTFWWVSQLGMIPGTLVYVYAGSTVPSLQKLSEQGLGSILSWQLATALVLLGLFPWFTRGLLRYFGKKPNANADANGHEADAEGHEADTKG